MFSKKKKIIVLVLLFSVIFFSLLLFKFIYSKKETAKCNAQSEEYYVGGEAVGIKLLASGVLVMGVDRDDIDIKTSDIILEVNGNKIETDKELEEYASSGEELSLKIQRDDKIMQMNITPKYNATSGKYRLGLWVKDSSAGVGTVTFYRKSDMKFASLGHAITETSKDYILPITTGGITKTNIFMIKKGTPKVPGELKGTITNDTIGEIYTNTENGVFGKMNDDTFLSNDKVEICRKEDIKAKEAYIIVTLDDNVKKKYKIEIEKVYLNSTGNKNIAIKVTDEELINKTGGIVQGMSGAPVIQDGKLVGAITHVFLDDPTRGYACFIENMINDMDKL